MAILGKMAVLFFDRFTSFTHVLEHLASVVKFHKDFRKYDCEDSVPENPGTTETKSRARAPE